MRISQHNILLALDLLAEQYAQDAKIASEENHGGLVATFTSQRDEVAALRSAIESYDDDAPLTLTVDGF